MEVRMSKPTSAVAIIPCNDLAVSLAFYALLGFSRAPGESYPDYAILADGKGAHVHLTVAPAGWLIPGNSPFGLYIYTDTVEELAERLAGRLLHPPRAQPWGMFEFAVSDPDENLVRVGRRL
jgi:catechol 2,3-dioxygenase-like lactoylglutathione lyase family enzyme